MHEVYAMEKQPHKGMKPLKCPQTLDNAVFSFDCSPVGLFMATLRFLEGSTRPVRSTLHMRR